MLVKTFPDLVNEFFSAAAPIGQLALNQLPVPPADFTGRADELSQLKRKVEEGQITIVGLFGQGGIGKTTLALKFAEELRSRYFSGQLHVDLKGTSKSPLSRVDAMSHVIRAYHPTFKPPETESEVSVLFRSVLHNQQVLLLVDNAADIQQVRPLIPPQGSLLLVTSRQSFTLPGMFSINLDSLIEADAKSLLLKIAPRIGDQAEVIARLCGFLPLALRASASQLQVTTDMDPADYATKLADERTRIQNIGMEGVEISLDASLNLSYESLDPSTSLIYRRLAVFPGTFDAGAEELICEDEDHAYLSKLVRCSLVLFDPDSKRYRLHDLVRLHVSRRLAEDERKSIARSHAAYYFRLLTEANELYCQSGKGLDEALELFEREWTNIQTGHKWGEDNIGVEGLASKLLIEFPVAGEYLLSLRQSPQDRIRWLNLALDEAKQIDDGPTRASLLNSLGRAHSELGAYKKSVEFHEKALAISVENKDRAEEGRSRVDLGTAHAHSGDCKLGIELQEEGLAILRELNERRRECDSLNRLGWSYADVGEYRRAIEAHEEALNIAREIGDRLEEGVALEELGWAYSKLNEVSRAIELQEQGLDIFKKLGAARNQAKALKYLGYIFSDSGEAKRALELHEQGLLIAQDTGNTYEEGVALDYIGWAHRTLGNHDLAIDCHRRAAEAFQSIGNSEDESVALRSLADNYCEIKEPQAAATACQAADTLARKESNRLKIGEAFLTAGNIYLDQEDYPRASECFEDAVRIAREVGNSVGEGHAFYNLGLCHTNYKDTRAARAAYQQSVAAYQVAGASKDAFDAAVKLGLSYLESEEYDVGIECLKLLLAEVSVEEDQTKQVGILYMIGQLYYLKGENLIALDFLQQALPIAVGFDNPRYATDVKFAIARALFKLDRNPEAVEYAEQILPLLQADVDKLMHIGALYIMGYGYQKTQQLDRAIEYLEKYLAMTKDTAYLDGEGPTLYNVANLRMTLYPEDPEPAINLYEQAILKFRETGNREGELFALNNLAVLCSRGNDHTRAVEHLEVALVLAGQLGMTDLEHTITGNLGDAFKGIGDRRRAIECYETYLDKLRKSTERPKEATLLTALGNLYLGLYDYARADHYFGEALQVSRAKINYLGEAWALNNLGVVRHRLGEPAVALEFYQQSWEVCRDRDDQEVKCQVLNNLGEAYLELGNASLAMQMQEDSLDLARQHAQRTIEGYALDDLADCYLRLGYVRRAIALQEESLTLFREEGSERDEAIVLTNLGEAHYELGELELAKSYYQEARERAGREGLRIEALALNGLGATFNRSGETTKAKELLESAIGLFRRTKSLRGESSALNNLGNVYRSLGDCDKAIEVHSQALEISQRTDRFLEGLVLGSLAEDFAVKGEFADSLAYYERQLELVRKIGDRRNEGRCLINSSKVLEKLGKTAQATQYANAGLEIHNEIENSTGSSISAARDRVEMNVKNP